MASITHELHAKPVAAAPQTLWATLQWLLAYWRPLSGRLLFLLLATPVTVALDVWVPMLIKHIFDELQHQGLTTALLAKDVLILLGLGMFHFVFYTIVQTTRGLTNFHFENVFRIRLSNVMLELGLGFFQKFRTGDVTTRLIDDISEKKLGWFACSGIFRFYEALLTIAGCLWLMIHLSWGLTLLTCVPLIGMAWFYIQTSKRTTPYAQQSQKAISELNAYLTSTLDGIRVVKAYGQEQRAIDAFDQVVEHQYAKDMELIRVSSLLEMSYSRFSELGVLLLFVIGGWLVIQNQLSIGALMAFNLYIMRLIWPMVDIGQFFIKGRQASVSVQRVRELEDYPQEIQSVADPRPVPSDDLELAFEHISFGFGSNPVLQDVSFTARSGQITAIAGTIGGGKSLLLHLIPRMLEAQVGQILLNQSSLAEYDLQALRHNIGFVSQTPNLFSATIRENILFGRQGVAEEDLQAAIWVAQLEQDLPLFPQGLETAIGQRGVKLSGGQKQRIAIARALLSKPAILILDDCTSALDAETESRFWQALQGFSPNSLVLLVTHRIRTLQQVDQIILLDQGRVVVQGHHQDLMREAVYRQVYLQDAERLT